MRAITLGSPLRFAVVLRVAAIGVFAVTLPPFQALIIGLLILLSTAYTPPRSYAPTGDLPDADDMNTYVRDNLNHLKENSIPVGTEGWYPVSTPPIGWLVRDGQAVSRTTYPDLFALLVKKSTVTITIASPGVVSWTAHGRAAGEPVTLSTTGALPTGLVVGTTYYVLSPTTDTFQLSATPGGSAINTSGSQSGVHTATFAPYGEGDGTTTFNLPNVTGRSVVGVNSTYPLASTGGAESHVLTVAETPPHTHTQGDHTHQAGYNTSLVAAGGNALNSLVGGFSVATDAGDGGDTGETGGGTAFSIRNPYIAQSPIIKY